MTNSRRFQFENARLVKVDGMRPEYMSGQDLIATTRYAAELSARLEYHIREISGCFQEYVSTPCASTKERLGRAIDIAQRVGDK